MANGAKANRSKLTAKQRLFAHEFARHGGNATEAAKSAGYSDRSAYAQGSRLLKNAEVGALITELQAKQLAKVDATAERVKAELARIAFADFRKLFDETGALRAPKDLDDATAAVVAAVDVTELFEGRGEDREHVGSLRKVKLWSKIDALITLAKHHGLLIDRVEFSERPRSEILAEVQRRLAEQKHHQKGVPNP